MHPQRHATKKNLQLFDGEPTLFELAAAYGYGLAKNHPFIDGNKRTAFMVMYVFLGLNGYFIDVPEPEVVTMMERLATDRETQESIGQWLERNSVRASE